MPQTMRVSNSADYNKCLKRRGQVFSMMHATLLVESCNQKRHNGNQPKYSHALIKVMYKVACILGQGLRQICGFFEDYAVRNNIHVDSPDYSTLSRRLKTLEVDLLNTKKRKSDISPIELAFDSTTLSIYGTNGTHSKEYTQSRRFRGYDQTRKLHVSIDINSKIVNALSYTLGTFTDHQGMVRLLKHIKGRQIVVQSIRADCAYDRRACYLACYEQNIVPIIPPMKLAVIKPDNIFKQRNEAISLIGQYGNREEGLAMWKRNQRYGRRSHVEGFFGRFKKIFGFTFRSRSEENRRKELLIKCEILNDFTRLGMPRFELA